MPSIKDILSSEFNLNPLHVENVLNLIEQGNTIPFIARYRKELTGSMDDQVLRELSKRLAYLQNLETRRLEIIKSITEQEKMTDALEASIAGAATISELDDIYRPYKPKRRTRATIARERGLEQLAHIIMEQKKTLEELKVEAAEYISEEKQVPDADSALAGACDIIAEDISDDASIRKQLRAYAFREGVLESRGAKDEDSVYRMYYEFNEAVKRIQSHRILAINRGERETYLKVSVKVDNGRAVGIIYTSVVYMNSACHDFIRTICEDAWTRLIFPSIEREIRSELTDLAEEQAIKMFGMNLGYLLMQPPIKGRNVIGIDPAYRTGCKVAVVDSTGRVLDTTVIYPTPPQRKTLEAKKTLLELTKKHNVTLYSIGNGTASKETEIFAADLISDYDGDLSYVIVNEAGASVYSASKLAADEFKEYDVSLRSAISIARRLQDPLAELVKIDPKSIGVGQYQHDMPASRLDETLGGVVESCVNSVGVDLNTASAPLLSYVSGISSRVAKNIITYREENGAFTNRTQLLKVPKLGPKSFLQCAGFLRIPESDNILDNTGVHPESYPAADLLLKKTGCSTEDLRKTLTFAERVDKIFGPELAEEINVGLPTLRDIITELSKPGRDPRDELPPPQLRKDIMDMKDLKPGMELVGTVRNVIDFGVFVDIGVHQDGLVHISQISETYIKHPSELLKVGDTVKVHVLEVDIDRNRISLTMKSQ